MFYYSLEQELIKLCALYVDDSFQFEVMQT